MDSNEVVNNTDAQENSEEVNSKIFPLASPELTNQILDVIQRATVYRQLRRGANEAVKSLHKGISELVVLAADAKPLEIISHIPLVCEDKVLQFEK
ncbi:13 kDa ribonucleoprotein-associated protein [Plasmodium yoelii yoelii]|uniref:H/ACA ribonucleoprotein complex subunit 2 n=1 Tax=Plasmodium yoelii yoelii TaxID=73239 RepID=A0AAE9WVU3_PLAYO|nr:13 kDa ribonucleoprotein-associated protein [Plasmodium yoelii yoelii]